MKPMLVLASSLAALTLATAPPRASAQTVQEMVGVWTLVKNETVRPDGTRFPTFGDNPHSQLILMANGRFSQIFIRSDLPKFASGSRLTGTAEENAAVVKGSSSAFGTWSLADKTVTLRLEASTYPNWTGTVQTRPLADFKGDEMAWIVPAGSTGNRLETVWRRLK